MDDGGQSALGWTAVHAFEAEHGVVLPEPYRTCVAEVPDGPWQGPPEYGLVGPAGLPVDRGDGATGRRGDGATGRRGDGADRALGEPFALTAAWLWEEDEGPYEDPDSVIDAVSDHGSVVLGTDGRAMNWHLVVTGPHRGHIGHVTDVGALPFGAEFGHTTSAPGFADWVAHWAAGKEWFDAESSPW
ncbi:SMI1/KNR4 family protein [Streptomyces stelliscabiei]|uniref:SMI1/KNR4 family protein n=1 Tax=Streptomyces stelliscabiei TaxID=146820 RepID=UPI002FF41DD0